MNGDTSSRTSNLPMWLLGLLLLGGAAVLGLPRAQELGPPPSPPAEPKKEDRAPARGPEASDSSFAHPNPAIGSKGRG
jgi:hypothetical protein